MPDEAKKLNFFNTKVDHVMHKLVEITSWLRHQPRIYKSKQTDGFAEPSFVPSFMDN